jgi:uncharacterized protein (DUF1697 family)
MPNAVAMLRGINVSGHKIVKMDALRDFFEANGFRDVRTYLQSGNVVFHSTEALQEDAAAALEAESERRFGFTIPILLRTLDELKQAVRRNPFLKQEGVDPAKLHVTFLAEAVTKAAAAPLAAVHAAADEFHLSGREIYLHCPGGYGRTKLSNNTLERLLKVRATTRNWKTVNALLAMAQDETTSC